LILLLFLASAGVIEWILHRHAAKAPESRAPRASAAHDLLALSSAIGKAKHPLKSSEAAPLASRSTIEQDVRQL